MAEFTVDISMLETQVSQMRNLNQRADAIAASVFSVGSSLGGILSLANKGYPEKIYGVRRKIRAAADSLDAGAANLEQVASIYGSYDRRAMQVIADTQAGKAAVASGAVTLPVSGKSMGKVVGDGLSDSWDQLVDSFHEYGAVLEDFHIWRSSKGSKMVDGILGQLDEGNPIRFALEEIVDECNDAFTSYEKVMRLPSHVFDLQAWKDAGAGAMESLGLGFASDLVAKYSRMEDYYMDRGASQMADGHLVQGALTSIAGSTLTFASITVDTAFSAAKWTAKKFAPGVKPVTKVIDYGTKYFTGKTAEDHLDNFLGQIGDTFADGLTVIGIG